MPYDSLINSGELEAHLQDPDWLIVDCRFHLDNTELGRQQFQESHIPGAIYAHLDNDLSADVITGVTGRHPLPSTDGVVRLFSAWGITAKTQVVVYDQGPGMIAARLWWMLKRFGHDRAAVLNGGWALWQSLNKPVSVTKKLSSPQAFNIQAKPALEASVQDVIACINDQQCLLLDARTVDRFRGENETIDPVAGHIPTAVSAPFIDNIGPDGCFLSKENLQTRFSHLLGESSVEDTIAYCGSGVTAAHNVLAMYHAGLGMPKLYVGSWSHWIADNNREVVVGVA